MGSDEGTGGSGAEWVRRYLASGEPRYFDDLVIRYQQRVLRVVLAVLGPELSRDAEDVTQEVFLKAHDRLATFRGDSGFGTWLYRVAYHRALDHRRAMQRRRRHERQDGAKRGVERQGRDGTERLLDGERDRLVHTALSRLREPYQTVLRSYYWLELPVAEIAELLGVATGTVKSYLYRGRARLARELAKEGFQE